MSHHSRSITFIIQATGFIKFCMKSSYPEVLDTRNITSVAKGGNKKRRREERRNREQSISQFQTPRNFTPTYSQPSSSFPYSYPSRNQTIGFIKVYTSALCVTHRYRYFYYFCYSPLILRCLEYGSAWRL